MLCLWHKISMRRPSFQFRSRFYTIGGILVFLFLLVFFWAWHNFFLASSKFIPDDGGIFTESTIGTIKNLNPLANDATLFDRDLQKLIFSGLLRYNPVSAQIEGALADFRISQEARRGLARTALGFIKNRLVKPIPAAKPIFDKEKCIGCGQCAEICPADALIIQGIEHEVASADYNKCIRCYCCHEICPVDAITIEQGRRR